MGRFIDNELVTFNSDDGHNTNKRNNKSKNGKKTGVFCCRSSSCFSIGRFYF